MSGNVKHSFVSGKDDGDDESLVRPSDWNDAHEVAEPTEDHHVTTKLYVDTADKALDYGLSFKGVVTEYVDTTHFKVSSLAGFGTGFFKPIAGSAYEILVVQADGAAPEGQQTPVVVYTSLDGTFQHIAFSVPLAIGDIVLIINPIIAALGTKASSTATGVITTTDSMMAYIKQVVTELQVADALIDSILVDTGTTLPATLSTIDGIVDAILVDTGTTIPALLATIAAYIDTEVQAILDDTGTTLPAQITALVTDYLGNGVHGLAALESLLDVLQDTADAIVTDVASAVPEPPTAKSLQDILHKDSNYAFDNTTDALESISDELNQTHLGAMILFIIPEAVAAINADNVVLQTQLAILGSVKTITQADALTYPAFSMYALAVCGTSTSVAWTTSNLADLKTIVGLPIMCVDKVAAAFFEIGTDGGDASSKTIIRAISEIEGTLIGMDESHHQVVSGLDTGNNIVSASATYHTLNMANANITEHVFCTEAVDPDGGSANTDVVMGTIPQILPDGTIGTDEDGADVPATLCFMGFCYDASVLNTLGKAAFYLMCHRMMQAHILGVIETPTAVVVDLRNRIFGNMKGNFSPPVPLVEWIVGQNSVGSKLPAGVSLADQIGNPSGGTLTSLATRFGDLARSLDLLIGARWDSSGDIGTDLAQLLTYCDILDDATNGLANIKSLIDSLTTALSTHDTDIKNLLATIAGYIDTEIVAIKSDTEAIIADTEDIQSILGTPANFKADLSTLETRLSAIRAGYLDQLDFALQEAIAAIPTTTMRGTDNVVLEGPTKEEMDIAHALLATEAKQDIINQNVDDIEALVDSKVAGKLQTATTTEDLNQGAATYDLFTGTTQAVRLESLNVKMPTGAAGGALTSISIQTDDATPGVIISVTNGVVANLTSEADLGWIGTLLINVGTKIRLTIAGGAHGSEYLVTVVAKCRAIVSGGYLT